MAEAQPSPSSLVSAPRRPAATSGLVVLDADALVARVEKVRDILDRVMKEGTHYHAFGVRKIKVKENCVLVEREVPNYSLGKAGAELICLTFGLAPDVDSSVIVDDPLRETSIPVSMWVDDPAAYKGRRKVTQMVPVKGYYEVKSTCSVWDRSGCLLARASGTCNSAESAFLNQDYSNAKNGVLKRSEKRAMVAAVLMATGASDIFTQDLEDDPSILHGGAQGSGAQGAGQQGSGQQGAGQQGASGWLTDGQRKLIFAKGKALNHGEDVINFVIARLNTLGAKAGRQYLDAIANGTPTAAEVWTSADLGVKRGASPAGENPGAPPASE